LVFDVAKVCIGNYFNGKTTIERFGRSGGLGGDLDEVWERMINNGIKGDKRVFESLDQDDFSKLQNDWNEAYGARAKKLPRPSTNQIRAGAS
jgi:hypothetical protein